MKLGVIADDFTGATDIAGFLVSAGMHTVQVNGVPGRSFTAEADALVVSLKSRSVPKKEAVEASLQALEWLKKQGCDRFYFKYCSTFDSSEEGNIGPVTDALLDELAQQLTIVCPALPVNGRTVYQGYLFAGSRLLSESGMQHHPVTPMRDADLVRLMEEQSRGRAGNIFYTDIEAGEERVRGRVQELQEQGFRYAVADALNERHLQVIADAVRDLPLVTGGSGLAPCLCRRETARQAAAVEGTPTRGRSVILSGSCAGATNRQVEFYRSRGASRFVESSSLAEDPDYAEKLCAWVLEHVGDEYAPMLYSTLPPDELAGSSSSGEQLEKLFAAVASLLAGEGIGNFIIAGGETSGQVVGSLGIEAFHIGAQISPGVPWVRAVGQPLYLALKSGNFGGNDFFLRAQEIME